MSNIKIFAMQDSQPFSFAPVRLIGWTWLITQMAHSCEKYTTDSHPI